MSIQDNSKSADAQSETTEPVISRRDMMQATAGAIAATSATAAAAAATDDPDVNYSSAYADDPYIAGTVTIDEQNGDMTQMEYVADDGSVTSLKEDGVVMAEGEDGSPHNPVILRASDLENDEYHAFPRGLHWDEDGDGTAEDSENVHWYNPSHWSTTGATNGSITLESVDGNAMRVYSSALADGETVKATLDLSTVGANDGTITEGVSRRFIQLVRDIDALPSAVTIDYALIDSAGTEVYASDKSGGDTSLVDVLHASTDSSVVSEVRAGELESAQSVTLDDIERVQIRISASGAAADGDVTLHALNAEKSEAWDYGTEEYLNSDDEVDTRTVEEPVGTFKITSLDTLPDYFTSGTIKNVQLDVALRASEVPDSDSWVRVMDAPKSYSVEDEIETVYEFTWPSAYSLSVTSNAIEDVQALPSGNYLEMSYAVGINDIEEWDDIEDSITWTDKTGSLKSVNDTVTLKSSTAAGDRMAVRIRRVLGGKKTDDLLGRGGGTGAAVVGGGGGGGGLIAIFGGILTALAAWKREFLMGLFN